MAGVLLGKFLITDLLVTNHFLREPIHQNTRPIIGGAVMIAIIGLVGFIIVTALIQWIISAQVWQGSDIEDLLGDEDEPSVNRPVGLLPMLSGRNGC